MSTEPIDGGGEVEDLEATEDEATAVTGGRMADPDEGGE